MFGVFQVTIPELEQILLDLYLWAYCNSLELENDRLILFNFHHHTVFMQVLRLEFGRVFLGVDGSFLLGRCQGEGFGVRSVLVGDFGLADKLDLHLAERFDGSVLGFHEHDLFALFLPDLCWSLSQGELLRGHKVTFT
jgi:hypothetical protein